MRLLFNGTQIGETNAAKVVPARTLLRNARGLGYGFQWAVDVEAYLTLTDNAAVTSQRMEAVEAALGGQVGGDLVFQYDDHTPTIHNWLTADTFTGVRCTTLTWDGRPGAQFRTWRSFTCRFEWEELLPVSAGFLLDFQETVRIRGGVPAGVVNECVNNQPPRYRPTVDQTKWFATQSGRAVGLSAYPNAELYLPLWPTSAPLKDRDITKVSPEAKGDPVKYRGYEVRWSYEYESPVALAGDPAKWG
jgi:hypothetical protein